MPNFKIQGLGPDGNPQAYTIRADDEVKAREFLKASGVTLAPVAPARRVYAPMKVDPEPPPPKPGFWEYKMVPVAPSVEVRSGKSLGAQLAKHLEEIVDREAELGWEFYRVDTFTAVVSVGCLAIMVGLRPQNTNFYVATFRKPYE